jgi:hypothetical protein
MILGRQFRENWPSEINYLRGEDKVGFGQNHFILHVRAKRLVFENGLPGARIPLPLTENLTRRKIVV